MKLILSDIFVVYLGLCLYNNAASLVICEVRNSHVENTAWSHHVMYPQNYFKPAIVSQYREVNGHVHIKVTGMDFAYDTFSPFISSTSNFQLLQQYTVQSYLHLLVEWTYKYMYKYRVANTNGSFVFIVLVRDIFFKRFLRVSTKHNRKLFILIIYIIDVYENALIQRVITHTIS